MPKIPMETVSWKVRLDDAQTINQANAVKLCDKHVHSQTLATYQRNTPAQFPSWVTPRHGDACASAEVMHAACFVNPHSCAHAYPDELIKGNAPVFVGVHFLHDIADLCLAHPPALAQRIGGQAVQQHLNLSRVQAAIAIAVHLQPHMVDTFLPSIIVAPCLEKCKG